MALDGSFLRQIAHELKGQILDAKVDKIHQVSREELVIILRQRSGSCKLYLSAGADSPRIHLTQTSFENPNVLYAAAQAFKRRQGGCPAAGGVGPYFAAGV